MILFRDKDFEDALASPDALEKRLVDLRKQRKLAYGTCILLMVSLFIMAFAWLAIIGRTGGKQPPFSPVLPLLLVVMIQQMASALSAQSDIRALMTFRKLSGQQARD
ncbi:hypothetical protein [Luteolibacter luteus]|uniref:Uncharacterized protein n=1 Tax=Luteolibacter luteus TaxID=2728835 RepID=A0A858RQ54_9BACT|nr:hypothetical protein [Luteolibacter luteus]QJE99012.1 hypothetical protein HHL09_25605 [Luteolibacter luteus]